MNKKILVTGANGQLGQSIRRLESTTSGFDFIYVDHEELDLTDVEAISLFFGDHDFNVVVNCAAHTAVDKAESEPDLADKVNHQAPALIAKMAKEKGFSLIHVSTDYVFDGNSCRPYIETDRTNPESVYGDTKLKGELALLDVDIKGVVLRTSWVYSEFGNNFVKTMLRLGRERDELGVIFDQIGSPTYAGDLAGAILNILNRDDFFELNIKDNLYHYSNEGVASWFDFAKAIFEVSGVRCAVKPIETFEYPTPAKRPSYSLLNKRNIKTRFDIQIPYWRDSLKEMMGRLVE